IEVATTGGAHDHHTHHSDRYGRAARRVAGHRRAGRQAASGAGTGAVPTPAEGHGDARVSGDQGTRGAGPVAVLRYPAFNRWEFWLRHLSPTGPLRHGRQAPVDRREEPAASASLAVGAECAVAVRDPLARRPGRCRGPGGAVPAVAHYLRAARRKSLA